MNSELKVALFQVNLIWEEKVQNLHNFEKLFETLPEEVDVIVLPEMFSTGFSMNAERLAEKMGGTTVNWLKKIAAAKNVAIAGSLIISENNQFFNRFLFVHSSGKIDFYDKRHLFSLANEHKVYTSGSERVIINYKGWKILPQICYDLRFPVFSRNSDDYDLVIYVANWPKIRETAWDSLLKARAIENISFVIGVNRIGTDGNQFNYNGHSIVYDGLGNSLNATDWSESGINVITLNKNELNETREKLNFLNDRDYFNINEIKNKTN